eukprot:257727-Prymnesium_polylepis.2
MYAPRSCPIEGHSAIMPLPRRLRKNLLRLRWIILAASCSTLSAAAASALLGRGARSFAAAAGRAAPASLGLPPRPPD